MIDVRPWIQAEWIHDLESDRYKQARSNYCNFNGEYCCLAVAGEITIQKFAKVVIDKEELEKDDDLILNVREEFVGRILGLDFYAVEDFIAYNDDKQMNFKQIAENARHRWHYHA